MELYDFIVKSGTGKSTTLDKQYSKLIHEIIQKSNEVQEGRWETYNFIIKELFVIDNGKYFKEIKYRLTDSENPNEVILDILSRYQVEELTFLTQFLLKRVEEYLEEDFFGRFI